MGYGVAPSWAHSSDRYYSQMMHESAENKLSSEITRLKEENEALKAKIKELEAENQDLRKYIDCLKS